MLNNNNMETKQDLSEYKGISVIYALYTEQHGIKYVGHSIDVKSRFRNHLSNHPSEKNTKKFNFIEKYKSDIKIKILSDNHIDWELEEIKQIKRYSENDLLNICLGGKNNRKQKPYELQTNEDHLLAINKTLKELNTYYESIGKKKRFELFTKEEINNLSNGIYTGTN